MTDSCTYRLASAATAASTRFFEPSRRIRSFILHARLIAEGREATLELPDPSEGDLRALLHRLGKLVLKTLSTDRDALRVAWRDLPAFPALGRHFVDERLQVGFRLLAGWLTQLRETGRVQVDDPQATAAVLLSSLAFFRLTDAMFGERPAGGLSDSRFLDAWVGVAMRALAPEDATASRRRDRASPDHHPS